MKRTIERWQEAVEAMTEDERAKLYWDALIYGTCMVEVPADGPLGEDVVRRVEPTRIILKGDGTWEGVGVAPLNPGRLVQALDMLRELEFCNASDWDNAGAACPICNGYDEKGHTWENAKHKPDCRLAALLAGAEAPAEDGTHLPPVDTSGWEVTTDARGTTVVRNRTTYAGNINPAGLGLRDLMFPSEPAPDRGPMGGGLPGPDVEIDPNQDADDARWIAEEHEAQAQLDAEGKS